VLVDIFLSQCTERLVDSMVVVLVRDAGTRVHYGGTAPLTFERGATGTQVPLHNSIINNFMIYQDRLETNLLQLYPPT